MDSRNESKLLRYSICCTNLPEALLNKVVAKQHFAQFGKIATMYVRPQQMSCTIDYVDKDSAEDALEYGGEYDGKLFDINWAPTKKTRSKVVDPDWLPDPDVQAELDALQALTPPPPPRLSRQQSMVIDLTQNDDEIKKPIKSHLFKAKKTSTKSQKPAEIDSKPIIAKSINIDHLKDILTTPALTIEQKYRVLDARDQLIRLQNSSEVNVKSDHIKGTCPDMCPEKERLMREYQHQVAQYEQSASDSRVMNHKAAVKQYSRSSADQEIPLPHDLRPVPVLERTMSYLLQKIADLSEEDNVNLNDWYHFFWDRTRSIRKDITQQGLSCKGSVKLVEQCSRFHIHCAARLAAEDASVFDQRINTENLTKCIQSLKYMYYDLRQKGEICDNEAEFCAYIILLNLNNCNFMWEVQKWSRTIQESPHVQFAIKVFLAVDSNNYVKFFKLVRETTYLNACLLLRYFNQVRAKAIATIVKSFVARIPTTFSLTDMTNILAFETIEQCATFVQHFGLSYNIQDDTISLDKQTFIEPDFPFHLSRCLNVIESKRVCSVGEAIYGGVILENDFSKYLPHCSFDEEGYLTKDALSAADQNFLSNKKNNSSHLRFESSIFDKIDPAPDVQKPAESVVKFGLGGKSMSSSTIFSNSTTRASEATKNVFQLSKNIFAQSPATPLQFNQLTNTSAANNIFASNQNTSNIFVTSDTNIFSKVNKEETKSNVFAAQMPTQNNFSFIQGNTEKSKSIFVVSTACSNVTNNFFSFASSTTNDQSYSKEPSLISSINTDFTFNLPKKSDSDLDKLRAKNIELQENCRRMEEEEERKKIEEVKKQKQIAIDNCIKASSELLEELLCEEISNACKTEINNEFTRYIDICNSAKTLTEQTIVNFLENVLYEEIVSELNVFRALKNIQTKEEERLSYKYFCLWLQNVLVRKLKRKAIEETPVWLPSRSVDEEASLLYRENQNSALENILNYKNLCIDSIFINEEPIQKINNFYEFQENIINTRQGPKPKHKAYWKMVISIPDEIEASYWSKYINNWIDAAFKETEDSTNANQLVLKEFTDRVYATTMAVSFKKSVGCYDNFQDLLGMNSLIFFTISNSFYQNKMKERLMKILKYQEKITFYFVIIIIKLKSEDYCDVKDFQTFLDDIGLEEKYNIFISEDHKFRSLYNSSMKACDWLSKQRLSEPPLQMNTLESFVYECLGSELIQKLAFASRTNYVLRKLFLDVNFIIELYNSAVRKCLEMVSEEALQDYQDFAPELKQFLPSQHHTALTYEYFPSDWRSVKNQCKIRSIIKNFEMPYFEEKDKIDDFLDFQLFLQKYCSNILSGSEEIEALASKLLCVALRTVNPNEEFQKQIANISWIDVVDILVRELVTLKLKRILDKNPLIIIYNYKLLTTYLNEPWWLKAKQFLLRNRANRENFKVVEEEYDDESNIKKRRVSSNISTKGDMSNSISRALKTLDSFDRVYDIDKVIAKKELNSKYEKLNLTLQEQANKLRAFNEILDKTVKNFR